MDINAQFRDRTLEEIDFDWQCAMIDIEEKSKSYDRARTLVDRIIAEGVYVPRWRYVWGTILGLSFCFGSMILFLGVAIWLNS